MRCSTAIVSLLSVALIFFMLGAPFAAALEVVIYAGAIMVLFVFVIMMINSGSRLDTAGATAGCASAYGSVRRSFRRSCSWNCLLSCRFLRGDERKARYGIKEVGIALLGPYMLGVELSSLLLTAGLVGAYHLGKRKSDDSTNGRTLRLHGTNVPAEHGLILAATALRHRPGRRARRGAISSSCCSPWKSC